MYKLFVTYFIIMVSVVHSNAQHGITGEVLDAETGRPIAGASIFINNTTYGTSSTDKGGFSIVGIPVGTYEVVVSSMGYHVYIASIDLSGKQPGHLHIALNVKSAILDEVEITPFEKDGWKRWGVLFFETVIGTSPNATQTKLLNQEVLRFRYDKENKLLEVIALEPLLIENSSLGYRLEYVLEECRIDLTNKIHLSSGYPHFQEMEAGNMRKRRFERRRKETYETSMMRFMRALYHETLAEEGYQVRHIQRKTNLEKQHVLAIQGSLHQNASDSIRQLNTSQIIPTDMSMANSSAYLDNVSSKKPNTVVRDLLTEDDLLKLDTDGKKRFAFSDFLHIQNIHLLEQDTYLEYVNEYRERNLQTSVLSLVGSNYLYLESNGRYFPPQAVFTEGYWEWCNKLADLLPLDYMPPDNH